MKNLIVMMNAMKHYNHEELVSDESLQEKLSQDINVPGYCKLKDMIHTKHFRSIKRK